ncbi:DUF2285 domain-containing protein [Cognatishimia sp. F0-27]|uniref:DUF2285 domain-containing protein n=1 Tax=Cognatishimia sp. F0-27 TaxID=2816855 RepID=UPI001D0C76F4|nr:DUF2285 domain-containing protein [Cognatishimia sp. F0-27]
MDPSVVVLQKVPKVLSGAVEPTILPEGTVKYAHDGIHHLLDASGKHRLQILQSDPDADALVAIVPLDQDGFARLDAVFRLLAQLHGRLLPDDKRLTRQKRLRAKRMLQAYDGHMARASQREIAEVVFRLSRVSRDEWQSAPERFAVMALLRDARKMVEGGYCTLLRSRRVY